MNNFCLFVFYGISTLVGIVDQYRVRKKDTNSGLRETSILNESINTA